MSLVYLRFPIYICGVINLTEQQKEALCMAFLKYGVKSVSMDDVAKMLSVSKKTLYEKISSKEELVCAVFDEKINKEQDPIKCCSGAAEDAVDEMIHIYRHLDKCVAIMSPTFIYDLKKYYRSFWSSFIVKRDEKIQRMITNNIERGKAEGLYHVDVDTDMIARLYHFVVTSIVENVVPMTDVSKSDLIKEFFKYHLRGICTQEGLKKLEQYDL